MEEIVAKNCGRSAGEIVDAIFKAVQAHCNGVPAFDDETVVVMKVKEQPEVKSKSLKAKKTLPALRSV